MSKHLCTVFFKDLTNRIFELFIFLLLHLDILELCNARVSPYLTGSQFYFFFCSCALICLYTLSMLACSCATHALVSILLNCPTVELGCTLNNLRNHVKGTKIIRILLIFFEGVGYFCCCDLFFLQLILT